ncbi:MAG: hypothetical protein JW983_09555 [Elusimicrobia bacterium]|nr:hypothetical protein [Elusimicrobiota bacterium]
MMEEKEIDLRDYLRGIWKVLIRNWKLIAGVTFICGVLSFIHLRNLPDVYESKALIVPAKIQKENIETTSSIELLLKNPLNPYLKDIAKIMNLKDSAVIAITRNFEIKKVEKYLEVSAKGETPEKAKGLADLICEIILKRQNELVENALKIIEKEITRMEEQVMFVQKEVNQLNKKIAQKEKTDILAQSYVYQSLIESKENALVRRDNLLEGLRKIKMELKYDTRPAELVAAPCLLKDRIASNKLQTLFKTTGICFGVIAFLVLIVNYFKNGDRNKY